MQIELRIKLKIPNKIKDIINTLEDFVFLEKETKKEGIIGFKDFKINKAGIGAVEKNIEIIIGRGFKKQGMSWSK
jgi:hypothetical protein